MRRFRLTVGKAHRKVTPAAEPRVENLDVAGAVHRLHGHFHVASEHVDAFSVRGCTRSCQNASVLSQHSFCTLLNMFSLYLSAWPDLIHKVLFTIGMQASQLFGSAMDKRVCPLLSPCIAVRRNHFLVAATVNLTADVVLQGVHHLGAVGVPEHHARRMVFDVVEIHLTPSASAAAPRSCRKASFSSRHSACTLFLTDAAVVALFGFFKELQISFQAFLVGKAGTVNAGKLVAVLVAVPVCTCEGEQLERLQLASAGNVRTCTEVFPVLARFAVSIETQGAVGAFASQCALGVLAHICAVGLYCKATRAHLRHARAALATKPRFASLVPKGSLSLTQMLKIYIYLTNFMYVSNKNGQYYEIL